MSEPTGALSREHAFELDSTDYYRVELGKHLFYDPILSRDSTISCATCHKQELAFTDGLQKSVGIRNRMVTRNSPTLSNVGNRTMFLLDGVNPSLESQVGVPIQEHNEFDFHVLLVIDRIQNSPKYVAMAEKAYNTSEITEFILKNSIATFERTLISDNSPYDKFLDGNYAALDNRQKKGMELFFETLYCSKCHSGPDFTEDRLTNNGLYTAYADSGRMRLTEAEADRAIFKVPTLRNVAKTAPYMHDGSIATLEEVIKHYESGGHPHPGKGEEIVPFELTAEERQNLIRFLEALTDEDFLTNPAFRVD
ncbi:MAG: cytochrome-c peroxidase [Fluviicola sp. XM-24bin1]|nr:MAG: cytochrome-c peroxidase [Fluviicola sp. XM-24bin1]